MDTQVNVVFSAVGNPENFVVAQSLEKLDSQASVYVITSRKFSGSWNSRGAMVHIAASNSMAYWRKLFRHLLVRIAVLRIFSRRIRMYSNSRRRAFFMPPHNARHFEYLELLRKLDPNSWTILVDSRDLVFQVKPEELITKLNKDFSIHLFDEGEVFFKNGIRQIHGLSPANWNWALQLKNFDVGAVDSLRNSPILNSGCIIGETQSLIELIEQSCIELSNSLWSDIALLDQASLNFVAFSDLFRSRVLFHKNGELVLNMCGVINESVELVNGQLFTHHVPISVVHQFDRFGNWNRTGGLTFSKREYRIQ